ncbi:MAG: 5-(carboxyamino)imidazole ribonucleotide mutase [Deltaproteobacteria bacterium]|nr:5-(carboxyamino)imidazole ribonucleotide mutase [Deltaproteobacteria bacterium]
MTKPLVGIVMGSPSDKPVMQEAAKVLEDFGVPYEFIISSAHRNPENTALYGKEASGKGIKVLICGAGMAAHLAGTLAAYSVLPVIGVPLAGSSLLGLDALLSTVQMPSGVPVATVAVGGAKNAAYLAIEILALADKGLEEKLLAFRMKMKQDIGKSNVELNKKE